MRLLSILSNIPIKSLTKPKSSFDHNIVEEPSPRSKLPCQIIDSSLNTQECAAAKYDPTVYESSYNSEVLLGLHAKTR